MCHGQLMPDASAYQTLGLGAGSHTVLDLLNNNYRVTIIDNFDNAFDECWARMQRLAGDKAGKMKLIRVRHLAACLHSGRSPLQWQHKHALVAIFPKPCQ